MASASYNMVRSLDAKFGFLWKYLIMKEQDVEAQALTFAVDYTVDVSEELVREMLHLKTIHRENLGKNILSPMHLLNRLWEENLDGLSPNICVALRLLCTLPVSVAGAERSFSGLANLKMIFDRLWAISVSLLWECYISIQPLHGSWALMHWYTISRTTRQEKIVIIMFCCTLYVV